MKTIKRAIEQANNLLLRPCLEMRWNIIMRSSRYSNIFASYVSTQLIDIVKIPSGMTSWECFICIFSLWTFVFCCENTNHSCPSAQQDSCDKHIERERKKRVSELVCVSSFGEVERKRIHAINILQENLLYICAVRNPLTFRCHHCLVIQWNIIVERYRATAIIFQRLSTWWNVLALVVAIHFIHE